jgi:hypothetical protein
VNGSGWTPIGHLKEGGALRYLLRRWRNVFHWRLGGASWLLKNAKIKCTLNFSINIGGVFLRCKIHHRNAFIFWFKSFSISFYLTIILTLVWFFANEQQTSQYFLLRLRFKIKVLFLQKKIKWLITPFTKIKQRSMDGWKPLLYGLNKYVISNNTMLLLDLRGHGSKPLYERQTEIYRRQWYSWSLRFSRNKKSHFVGISLGYNPLETLGEMYPELDFGRVPKMNRSQVLMRGNMFKYVLPYLVLYKFCVCNHAQKKSQTIACSFLSTRQKIIPKEFIKWFKLTAEINPY